MQKINSFNKFLIVLSLFIFSYSPNILAIRLIPDNNLAYPVLVNIGGHLGSGFYLRNDKTIFFISAKHVFFDDKMNSFSKTVSLISYNENYTEKNHIILNLKILNSEKNILFSKNYDVIIIALGDFIQPNSNKLKLKKGIIIKESAKSGLYMAKISNVIKFNDVLIGNDAYVFGYPVSIGLRKNPEFDYNKPLLKKGLVSGKYKPLKTIILDCSANKGNSGGPVIESNQISLGKYEYKIIGIMIRMIPLVEQTNNITYGYNNYKLSNSNYSVVLSMDPILDLIRLYEKENK